MSDTGLERIQGLLGPTLAPAGLQLQSGKDGQNKCFYLKLLLSVTVDVKVILG